MNLRERIAEIVREARGPGDDMHLTSIEVADRILAIPEIAQALKALERLVGKPVLGHSISTNKRTPV